MAAPTRRRAIRRHERRAVAINEFLGRFNMPELVEQVEEMENENNIQGEDVDAEQSQADVLKHLEVNKILEFEETNVTHRRYCGYLMCDQFADYKCNLVVSGKAKSYCFKCFERFRSKVVYCDADSTSSE